MTYNEFLIKLAQQRQGSPGAPQITQVRSSKAPQPAAGKTSSQAAGKQTAAQPVDNTQPYALPMEQWRSQWDWRQGYMPATVSGPNGEETPFGAQGWDYNGNAWYGDGMSGFLNELKSKLIAPLTKTSRDSWLATKPTVTGALGVPGGMSPEQIEQAKTRIGEIEQVNVGETAKNIEAGAGAGAITAYPVRVLNAGIDILLSGLGEVAKKTEQAINVAGEMQNVAQRELPMWFIETMNKTSMYSDPNEPFVRSRFDRENKTTKETFGDLETAYQAGRVLYTGWLDSAKKEEFERRYAAGENPYLLAQQLENPLAEMAGQLVLDPLNLIGLGTRSIRDTNRLVDAIDMYAKSAPEVAEFIKTVDTVDDIKSAEGFTKVVDVVMAQAEKVKAGFTRLATERGLMTLTADGARFEVSRNVDEVMRIIASASKDDPDEAVGIVRALMNLASGDADKTADALSTIVGASRTVKNLSPDLLLSEGSFRAGAVLREIVGDKPNEFLKAFEEARKLPTDEFIKWADKYMAGAIQKLIPTITDRVKLAADIASGKISLPTDLQRAMAQVSPAMQKLAAFDNLLQSGKFGVRAINGFFANVYLGLSPAYAARNAMQNYIQMFIDYGPGVFKGMGRATQDIKDWMGGVVPTGAKGFSSVAAATTKRFGMTKVAETIETGAANLVVRHSVEQTMRRMLQPGRALPDVAPLVDAGLSEDAANHLWRLVVDNKGNVGKAVESFFEKSKTGSLDAMETLGWLSSKDAKGLQDLKVYDNVLQTIRDGRVAGKTVDEVITDVRTFFDENVFKYADEVANDPQGVVPRSLDDASDLLTNSLPEAEQRIVNDLYDANDQFFYYGRRALEKVIDGAKAQVNATGNAELLINISKLEEKYLPYINGQAQGLARTDIRKWSEQWIAWEKAFESSVNSYGVPVNLEAKWKELGMINESPKKLGEFYDKFWSEFYYPTKNGKYETFRKELASAIEAVGNELGGNTPEMQTALDYATQADNYQQFFERWRKGARASEKAWASGNARDAIVAMASQYGIATAPKAVQAAGKIGAPLPDSALLNLINKYSKDKKFTSLNEVTRDVAIHSFAAHSAKKAGVVEKITETGEEIVAAAKNIPPYSGDIAPSAARVLHESRQGITELVGRIEQQIRDNFDNVIPVIGNERTTAAVNAWAEAAVRGVNDARAVAAQVANAARDFTLLPYGKKYGFDLVLNYTHPYQFWYSRTYANYLKRLAQTPDVIAGYAKYKEALGKIHAGAPEWWKYNINSNELLGLDSDNPLFFNLEATINPLNGLTGVDFNDPNKRVNWWTSMIDDMGKFGPSTWTPLNWAVAAALQSQGETDAAQRWGGRLFPQTATIKSLLYMANIKTGIPYNELDPMVQFMSGGLDPYEKKRVVRALGWMNEEGEITLAEMNEAGYQQSGPIWDEAVARAVKARAPGQISSFFLGVGFKGRSVSDIQIDQFYSDYYRMWDLADTLSPDELRAMNDELRTKYPFGDGIIMANKSGFERDRSYAYNVLARIAPGQKSEIAKAAGISPELMDKFYADKGNLSTWGKSDYNKFMAAIVDIGALLEVPESGTRQEWSAASSAYGKMQSKGKELFGTDIWDKLDAYNALAFSEDAVDKQLAEALLNTDPELQRAMDWKTQATMENELLYAYYGGIQTVEKYYRNVMYQDMRQRFGKDIFDLQTEYYSIFDSKERKAFLKEHPQLAKMWDAKRIWEPKITNYILSTSEMMPDGLPIKLRKGVEPTTTGQTAVMEAAQPERTYSWQEYQQILGGSLSNLVLDNMMGGKELNYAAQNQLEYIADNMGISVERLMALMAQSLTNQ